MEADGVRVRVRVGLALFGLDVKKGEIRVDEIK